MKRARQISLAKPAPWKRERLGASIRRWKPIALTWRKASRSARSHIASPGGAVARHNWSPRFNLNLHLAFTTRALPGRTGARSATASPIPGRQPHPQFTSLDMLARSSLTTETRRLISHRLRDLVTHERTKRTLSQAESDNLYRARIHTCAATETTSLTQLPRTTWRSRHRTMRPVWRTQAELVFEPSMPSTPAAAFRLPELVWHTGSQSKMLEAIERSIGIATPAVAPSGGARALQFEQSPAPFGPPLARTLDPALIDRVAEDVIGRVERRIRVERERRGV